MNKEKFKTFVKEHETEIIAGVTVVAGVVLVAVTRKSFAAKKNVKPVKITGISGGTKDLPIPKDFGVGKVIDFFSDHDEIVGIVQDITVNDLGALGEEFIKHGLIADGVEACVTVEFAK